MVAEKLVYAIDIGDSVMRAGVYRNGTTTIVGSFPTPKEDLASGPIDSLLWSLIAQMVGKLQDLHPDGLGLAISASGTMTFARVEKARQYGPFKHNEVIVFAPNVDGLKSAPVLACVERAGVDLPLHIENDMNAALTSATQFDDAVFIGLGAGLGGAIKKNGNIEHLPGTWSCFEIGHGKRWVVGDHFNRKCRCGTVGCLEAAIGGWAMSERYLINPEDAPDEVYSRMRNDVIALLPQAIARLANAAQIPTVLLGGKGSLGYALGSDFVARLTEATQRLVTDMQIEIRLVDLGEAAELHGAALAFLHHVRPDLGLIASEMPAPVAPMSTWA